MNNELKDTQERLERLVRYVKALVEDHNRLEERVTQLEDERGEQAADTPCGDPRHNIYGAPCPCTENK